VQELRSPFEKSNTNTGAFIDAFWESFHTLKPHLVEGKARFSEKLHGKKVTINCYSTDSFHDPETESKEKSIEAKDIMKIDNEINK